MDAPPPSSSISLPSPSISSLDPPLTTSSSSSTISSSKTLPLLPTELKREILRFCDPATLAKTSSLSLAFLQLSSPLLYNDVAVTGFKTVAKLFQRRNALHQPPLDPYLSLDRIRNLSITIELGESHSKDPPHFSPDRLSPSLLPLSSLSLLIPITPAVGNRSAGQHRPQWSSLLPLLDPIHVLLQGNLYTAGFDDSWSPSIRIVAFWRHLRVLTVEDCTCVSIPAWDCVSIDGEAIKVVLRSHSAAEAPDFTGDLLMDGDLFAVESSRVSEVVVQFSDVGTQSVWADLYHTEMEDSWLNRGVSKSEINRRLAMVRYEVV